MYCILFNKQMCTKLNFQKFISFERESLKGALDDIYLLDTLAISNCYNYGKDAYFSPTWTLSKTL